jgi:hypothetical protein
MIWYFRACASNQHCLDGGLTTKKEDTEPMIQVKVEVATMNWITVIGISVLHMTMDMFCMPFFHLSWLITWFVTREARRVQLLTLLEHLHSPPILVGFVFLNLYVDLLRPLFIYSSFFLFDNVLCGLHWFTSSDYLVFWWHLQTLLKISILCMYLFQLTCSVYAGQDFLRPDSSLWTWHLFRYPPITLYEDFIVVRVWMISPPSFIYSTIKINCWKHSKLCLHLHHTVCVCRSWQT